uniref:Uncharacterized protein n=1 Tax=Cacopsylla melanoneura TaxID=428564 RepID=A0A8D8V8F8_9HEMI
MEQSSCLLLPTLVLAVLSPALCLPGEKFRINPDDIERVKQMSNLTDNRDRTAKNVNFAWKMTVQSTSPTTQDPKYTSTLDPEMQKKNNEIYDKLFAQLAYTLRDKEYLNRWLTEMDKGYHIFLYEIQKQDKYKWFKRFDDDQFFEGDDGDSLFQFAVNYLRTLGTKEEFEKRVLIKIRPKRGEKDDLRIRKPTSSEERRNDTESYRLMQVHLAMALGNKYLLDTWMDCINKGGYEHLLNELHRLGPKHFLRNDIPEIRIQGAVGGIFWTGLIEYLRYLGQEGFNLLLEKVKALPPNLDGQELLAKKYLDLQNTS